MYDNKKNKIGITVDAKDQKKVLYIKKRLETFNRLFTMVRPVLFFG